MFVVHSSYVRSLLRRFQSEPPDTARTIPNLYRASGRSGQSGAGPTADLPLSQAGRTACSRGQVQAWPGADVRLRPWLAAAVAVGE